MKNKKIITILLSFVLTIAMVHKISKDISDSVINSVFITVERENTLALKSAFHNKHDLPVKSSELFSVVKNRNGEIMEVSFDIEKSEIIMNYITEKISTTIKKITEDGYILFIPMGSITHLPFLSNLGPKIPVKLLLSDIALASIRTEIRDYGINNALVEIYIDIDIKISPVLITNIHPKREKYSFLLASKLISGKVPELYGGKINKESSIFNLPVEKNM